MNPARVDEIVMSREEIKFLRKAYQKARAELEKLKDENAQLRRIVYQSADDFRMPSAIPGESL